MTYKRALIAWSVAVVVMAAAVIAAAVLLLNGDKSSAAPVRPSAVDSGFVTTRGSELVLDGRPFKFVGVNRYNLLTIDPSHVCGDAWTEEQLDAWFAEVAAMGAEAVRFWAFQPFTASGTDFARMDYVVQAAETHGVKLIPVLENYGGDCGGSGETKHEAWYAGGYRAAYGMDPISFVDYIDRIVPRYAESKAILMWQIMNEAENSAGEDGGCGDFAAFDSFARDVSDRIRALDPNHVISLGTIGSGQCGAQGDEYRQLHAHDNINILEVHEYGDPREPVGDAIRDRIAIADGLQKPFFTGEGGIKGNCRDTSCYQPDERADYFEAKIRRQFELGSDGYVIWLYRNPHDNSDAYIFFRHEPLATRTIPSIAFGVNSEDDLAPAPPVLSRPVLEGSPRISLHWERPAAAPDLAGYWIIRDGERIAIATTTSYVDPNVVPGRDYEYAVAAYDAANNVSQPSQRFVVRLLLQSDVVISCEAEGGDVTAPFERGEDPEASGGEYIVSSVTNNDIASENIGLSGRIVHIPQPGTYMIWSRVMYGGEFQNSFWLRFDASDTLYRVGNDNTNYGVWRWVNFTESPSNVMRVTFQDAGPHAMRIVPREEGARIDKIVLTMDPAYHPEGAGPPDNCSS